MLVVNNFNCKIYVHICNEKIEFKFIKIIYNIYTMYMYEIKKENCKLFFLKSYKPNYKVIVVIFIYGLNKIDLT